MNTLDKLLSKDYNYMQYAMSSSTDSTTQQIIELTAEKNTLISTLNTITAEMIDYLGSDINNFFHYNSAAGFGGTTVITDNVKEWSVFVDITESVALSADEFNPTVAFSYDGDDLTTFAEGNLILCDCGVDGIVPVIITESEVVSSGTELMPFYTTMVSAGSAYSDGHLLTSNLIQLIEYDHIYSSTPESNWDDDPYVVQRQDEYDYIIDHLYHPLGSSGSYGVVPRLAALTSAAGMVSNNKNKVDAATSNYLRFTDWGDGTVTGVTPTVKNALLDNAGSNGVSFVSVVSFSCSGDITSSFPISAGLLIDCGADGMRAGDVSTVTYYPPSAGDYTEVTVLPDFTLPFLTSNLVSVSASGSIITLDNLTYVDDSSFTCSGDLTSSLINSMDLTFDCGVDGLKEGWITTSAYSADTDLTTITVLQNFYLTNNLNAVLVSDIPLTCGIEYVNELALHCSGDQTSTLTPGLTGISCDCGNIDGMILCSIRTSEHKTGPGDYTLVTIVQGTQTSGIPITENIEKVYIQPS